MRSPTLEGVTLGGRYRLGRQLGEGGMGVVYEAVEERLGRVVALKLLSGVTASATAIARLRQEADATARLGHPHIVQVTDFQHNEGEPPFLVMELLHGSSMRALLDREGILEAGRVVRIGLQLLDALAAAHGAQIIHRDIKPDNVFVASSIAIPDMVKVLDFGIAKLEDDDDRDAAPLTRAGALIGTLAYMSPEQARGEPADARSDLYALGVVLYEALCGRRPIEARSGQALIMAIVAAEPVPLEGLIPDLDPALAAVIAKALRKDPRERWQSAAQMAAALAALVDAGRPAAAPNTIRSSLPLGEAPTARGDPLTGATKAEEPWIPNASSPTAPLAPPPGGAPPLRVAGPAAAWSAAPAPAWTAAPAPARLPTVATVSLVVAALAVAALAAVVLVAVSGRVSGVLGAPVASPSLPSQPPSTSGAPPRGDDKKAATAPSKRLVKSDARLMVTRLQALGWKTDPPTTDTNSDWSHVFISIGRPDPALGSSSWEWHGNVQIYDCADDVTADRIYRNFLDGPDGPTERDGTRILHVRVTRRSLPALENDLPAGRALLEKLVR